MAAVRESGNREPDGPRVLDLVAAVLRRWKTVLVVAVLTMLAAAVTSMLTPSKYVASTTMVPFTGAQARGGLGLAQLPAGVATLVGVGAGSSSERLMGVMLKSRTLADSMVGRLAPRYVSEAELRKILKDGTRVQRNPDGSVVVQVRSLDPRLAARIANTYPVLVNELMARVSSEGAQRKQGFLEGQLSTVRERLLSSEQRLLAFQRSSGTSNVDEQARRTLDAAADLNAQVLDQERAVAQLRRTLAPGHPELQAAEAELGTRRAQLRRVTAGNTGSPMFVPLREGGELKAATSRLTREFAQEEAVYEALTAALAEAQLDANNNLPVLSVLDPAQVPGPTGSLPRTVALAGVLGALLGAALALVADGVARARANPRNAGFFAALAEVRQDAGRLLPWTRGRARSARG
ncbi:Wzz/FepE/Etk N-terminal domain-containing protein [Longimicrobium sp.]|uniref:Wzz/FepE/Etk N-terminal domain-containing protein n=1 Tax=Longimicrobium sp. TaxID=2029185 RepID=UPI002ED968E7